MRKNLKIIITLLLTAACLGGFAPSVHASTATIPTKIRGTWYSYDGHNHYTKVVFTKHYRYLTEYYGGRTHRYAEKVSVYKGSHKGWYSINRTKKTVGLPAMYRYSPISIHGVRHRSLQFREASIYYRMFKTKTPHLYKKAVTPWF